jgi:hypothetical protein
MYNRFGYKIGDCFKVYLPEHEANHTPIRACVVIDTNYNHNELTILPFSRQIDVVDNDLTLIPQTYNTDKVHNVLNFGGRDLDGYIVPRLAGYINPNRLVTKLGVFNMVTFDQIMTDYLMYQHKYQLVDYT